MKDTNINNIHIGKIVYVLKEGVISTEYIFNIRCVHNSSNILKNQSSQLVINDPNIAKNNCTKVIVDIDKGFFEDNGDTHPTGEFKVFFTKFNAVNAAETWLNEESKRIIEKRERL